MPRFGRTPKLCPHGVFGVAKCSACAAERARRYRADPEKRARHNEIVRLALRRKRATSEGRAAHNAYMRSYNAGGLLEAAVEQHLVESTRARSGLCLKFVSPGRRGAPDRIVCLPGHPAYFIEVKRPRNGKLGAHQLRYHDALRTAGQKVWVLWSKEEVDAFFASI